jgi:hypothetical protein
VRRDKEDHYALIYNPARRHKNSKYICSDCWCTQIHKANTPEYKGTDRPRYNNIGRLQQPTLINRQNIRAKLTKIY